MNNQLDLLISYLLEERKETMILSKNDEENFKLFRTLINIRKPIHMEDSFLKIQDTFLKNELQKKGITKLEDLEPIAKNIYLWQGDITTLEIDAIVNSSDETLLGCFYPCHDCVNNAIHTYAGIQLRLKCKNIMDKQGHLESVGGAKVTNSYNLASDYIIHTVGPNIEDKLYDDDIEELKICYKSCLNISKNYEIKNIAFPCISTGSNRFPNKIAAEIAIKEALSFQKQNDINVVFNVFNNEDYKIYSDLLKSI